MNLIIDLQENGADSEPVDGRSLAEWLEWAEIRAVEADPLGKGAAGVFADIAEVTEWTYRS